MPRRALAQAASSEAVPEMVRQTVWALTRSSKFAGAEHVQVTFPPLPFPLWLALCTLAALSEWAAAGRVSASNYVHIAAAPGRLGTCEWSYVYFLSWPSAPCFARSLTLLPGLPPPGR